MACVSCQGKVPYDGYEWDEPQSEKCPFDDAIPCEWVCPNSKTDCSWKKGE